MSPVTFITAQVFSSIFFWNNTLFLRDILYKKKLLNKHNTQILKIAPVLLLLHKITTPLQLEIKHLFVLLKKQYVLPDI